MISKYLMDIYKKNFRVKIILHLETLKLFTLILISRQKCLLLPFYLTFKNILYREIIGNKSNQRDKNQKIRNIASTIKDEYSVYEKNVKKNKLTKTFLNKISGNKTNT